MSAPLETHGLAPLKLWKFWEIEGWQLLVSIGEHESDEARDSVTFSTGCDQLGSTITMTLSGAPDAMRKIFDEAANDEPMARKALQRVLDYTNEVLPGFCKKAAQA